MNRDNPARYNDSHCGLGDPIATFPVQTGALNTDNGNIELMRTVEGDGKKMIITYTGQAREKRFTISKLIMPKAMNWCG
ncbi:hypothetical protein OAE71_01685 [Synechococcus sp. AH-551-A21]|nr:hypothetical protein [Synechococcus sp. AH-551-A21]MDB4677851.1 hypothetical protein [Synechococcus sp. AH-551-A21]